MNTKKITKKSIKSESFEFNMVDFSGLKLSIASPDIITSWSFGEVTKPETINYRTFKPEKDGLFDERIFGPTKDYECYCGKYKRIRYKGIICDRCGVEITTSSVRRERMGHIKLATPIVHIWYFKGISSPLSILLDISSNNLERIIYYALYLVKNVDEKGKDNAIHTLNELKEKELSEIDEWQKNEKNIISANEQKEKKQAELKVKNKEQRDLLIYEIEFKTRERYTNIEQKYADKYQEKLIFYERIQGIISSVQPLKTIDEEDVLFLKEKNIADFLSLGMGSEVIFEVLSHIDLNQLYTQTIKHVTQIKGSKRLKIVKKIRLIESLIKSKIHPQWMIIQVLPVIPPDLRPVVQLNGGKFATSDLNDFYRRAINRNNRLKHLIELGAPEIILRNEKRMLQEAIDSLIDIQKSRGRDTRRTSVKTLKSLSDILRGKQGRFRQNLLGKRVDYSGRSVIIVGPELKIYQCGLPKEMGLELFKPFLLREVLIRGLAQNIKSAKNFLERKEPIVYDILEQITKDHPVILNRAPTLHKLSILAFYPILTDDYAIKLHPAVCQGYNADFDGDQMGVFVPLSKKAIDEIKDRMLAEKNLLKPSDGMPIVLPNKEMALGCYYLTTIDTHFMNKKDEQLRFFSSSDEALMAYHYRLINTREPILVKLNDTLLKTTIGRIIFNMQLPQQLQFLNREVKAIDLKMIIVKALKIYQNDYSKVGSLIDHIKEIGFWAATISGGVSISTFDCTIIDKKTALIKQAEEKITIIENNYFKGLLTEEEKKRTSNNVWIDISEDLADQTWNAMDEENPVKIIIKSGGARASREQLRQLSAMKGLVIDPTGKIIEVPTKSNYREGLSIFEYVISARGARKGLTDSALKTADAGYLTRRLVDVSHDMIVREDDCGTTEGLVIQKSQDRGEKFLERIAGRYTVKNILSDDKKTILIKSDECIDDEKIILLQKIHLNKVTVRSPLYCQTKYGVCRKCYGIDLANNQLVEIGTPVGVVAAQSIGEPGTQLTMRVRHFGGIVIADVTQGLPRVEELFEARTPKIVSPISDIAGKVSIQEDTAKEVFNINIKSIGVKNDEERNFVVPSNRKLKLTDGQLIHAGQSLSEGYLDIKEILAIKGLREGQIYLLNEIQQVYESQGIMIHDKHFEVIIRKMSDKVIVENEGDTSFIVGEVVSKFRFQEENKKALSQGGRPASGTVSILGVTRAAIHSDSWLSSASFQGTTTALMQASLKGQVDEMYGLKENVIIGRLIPVTDTLLRKYYPKYYDISPEEITNKIE
ncbi:MAG TPA: DNA-directed RNA polymerase subunit beta' [Patescibacteria group bacterium]|nr:DNA-directed RNA polymerase subunit beta' [Patescibacteria group bacterium]